MLLLLLTAAAYFYFNWSYFTLLHSFGQRPRRRVWLILASFAVNYLFFYLCSVLEFPLVINWFLFAFLLFLETLLYNGGDKRRALSGTLLGILYGLAVNIFCRSVVAMILREPLRRFDNHSNSAGNLKGIPVFFGFLLAGALLHLMRRPALLERIRLILRHPKQQSFLLEMMAGLFFYLFLNLLLYATPRNDWLLKVWSIKSCLFCVIGFCLAARYTLRVCELSDYREQNRQMERELEERRRAEERLRQQAASDMLTGLYNRQAAEEALASMTARRSEFTLCFLDLDGLKNVNDQYGHDEGDRYILTVTERIRSVFRDGLFRYGGDEFLVLLADTAAETAEQKAEAINRELRTLADAGGYPYPLSLSYGIAESTALTDWKTMIREADRRMYAQKRQKRAARDMDSEGI